MIYNPEASYSQAEIDHITGRSRNELYYESEALKAFSKLPVDSYPVVEESEEEAAAIVESSDTGYNRQQHVKFPLDWKERAIPSKLPYDDQIGFFYYYARNNRIEGYIVPWQHGWFRSYDEGYDWIKRMVIKKSGLLHDVGIEDSIVIPSPYGGNTFDVYFYFTDGKKAWDFFCFQDVDNEEVNWHDYK